ncbi:MAG: VTT domain-containing protein [Cyanobacteria bacterium P01_A01_bin.84]
MNKPRVVKILKFCSIILLVALAIWLLNHYGIEQIRANVKQLGIWAPLGIFVLRFTSVIIPALPSTAYSLLAGSLFGFTTGVIVVASADIISCTLSFYLSRRYGRDLVKKLVGDRFMSQVDKLTQRHLENNFFLMTAFMMTGLFDFVSYAVGLTKASSKKFIPALVLGVAISNPPIVALGAGLWEGSNWLLVLAVLGVFTLAFVTGIIQRKKQDNSTKANE